jgi:hypothetical protein
LENIRERERQQQGVNPLRMLPAEPEERAYPVNALHLGAAINVAGFAAEYKQDYVDVINNPPHRDHSIFQVMTAAAGLFAANSCWNRIAAAPALSAGCVMLEVCPSLTLQ